MGTTLVHICVGIAIIFAVLWLLWQLRVISPVKQISNLKALKKFQEVNKNGKETSRFMKEFRRGFLWWGYDPHTHHEYDIFNGKHGSESFQVQNWRPRIAFWGGQLIGGQRPVRRWNPVDPTEALKFRWPSGTQAQLKVYPKSHPQRKPTEAYFANQVRKDIQDVRHGNAVNLWLLIESLKNLTDRRNTSGFHTWLWAIEGVLGADTCRAIGKAVCEQEHFTIEEGERLQKRN